MSYSISDILWINYTTPICFQGAELTADILIDMNRFYSRPENAEALAVLRSFYQLPNDEPLVWSRNAVIHFLNLVASKRTLRDPEGKTDGMSPFIILTIEAGLPSEMSGVLHSLSTGVLIRKMELKIADAEFSAEYREGVAEYLQFRSDHKRSRL